MTREFKHKLILYSAIVVLIVFIFFQQKCSGQEKTTTKQVVTIPEKVGEFKKPTAIIYSKGKKDSIEFIKGQVVHTENPFDKRMAELYLKAQRENDSLKQFQLYVDAIQETEQTQVFDDEYLRLEVIAKTRGELLSLKPKYTIKERQEEVEVKQKEQVFALYGGVGISDNKNLDEFAAQAEVGIQLKKGDIISVGYDTKQNFSIRYTKQIFKIKR